MAQVINTNIASLTAQRTLAASQKEAATAMQRLSSGLRINSAKDDAAGLAIGNRLTAQINGINQAIRNANDGLSVAQVSEGALSESSNLLQRMRELAVQSANASNSSSDRTALQTEVTELIAEMDRISTNTKFGNVSLLDGTFSAQSFQVGANASETLSVTIASAASSALGSSSTTRFDVEFANFKSANATESAATTSSGVSAQTLTIETNGVRSNVDVAANATAGAIATSINAAQSDLTASASTGAQLDFSTGYDTASDTYDITINGVAFTGLAADNSATASASLAAAIAGNATLSASLTVTDGGGTVDLRDATGGDISVVITAGTDTGTTQSLSVQELDTDGNLVGIAESLTNTEGTTVTGDITFTTADTSKSYALFSSDSDGGITSASSAVLGDGFSQNITFNDFETRNATGTAAATGAAASVMTAHTLTFVTDGSQQSIAVGTTDSAADIAESVTNNVSGISADAITQARVTMTSTGTISGLVDVIINEVEIAQVTAATDIETTAGLVVAAINDNEGVAKAITAVDNGDGTFDIIDASGDDIRFELTASDNGTVSETLSASIRALDADGVLGGNAATAMNHASSNEVIVTGSVLFTVDDTSKTYSAFASSSAGTTTATAAGDGAGTTTGTTTVVGSAVNAVDISTAAGATSALGIIDAAITSLDAQRATLGAVQNRFDSVISNLSNVSENTSAARSRIMDADFASETAQLARTQILQQAGISVLAQANAQPQNVLALLQ